MNLAKSILAAALVVSTGVHAGTEIPCVTPLTPGPHHSGTLAQELKFNGRSEKVAIHHGHGGSLFRGFTDLDKPVTFHCRNESGCLLSVLGTYSSDGTFGSFICVLLDGALIRQKASEGLNPLMEAKRLTVGDHVVRSQIWAYNPGTLGAWQMNYTLYDEPHRP